MKKSADVGIKLERKQFIKKSNNIDEAYIVTKKPLAAGSYGAVHLCSHKITKESRAVKIIPRFKITSVDSFTNEIDMMKLVDHPNIIRLYEWFEDKSNLYIVMDLCTGGELFDKISSVGSFNEHDAANLFKQMMNAVNYCTTKKICHKDLKPENFMFASKDPGATLKLIDFGLSQIFEDPKIGNIKMKAKVGTPYYIAPEVIKGEYDEKCDVWSMGVILYVLICGAPPFYGPNDFAILEMVKKMRFEFDLPIWNSISAECKDLVSKMLSPVDKRLTSQQVLDHPWIANHADKPPRVDLPPIVTKQLKVFRGAQKVKKIVLTYLATQLSEKELEPLKKLFMALDKNGDGILSMEEISEGLKGRADQKEMLEIMQSMDTDGSGFVDYNEFAAAALGEEVYLNSDKLLQAFNMFDKDKSGKIDANEIKEAIGEAMAGVDEAIWIQMIKDADVNGDGQIDFDEFLKMMYTLKESSKYC